MISRREITLKIQERIQVLLASQTRRRLASGALWGGVAVAGSRGLTVVASFFIARILGKVGFGEYGMVNSTAAMVSSMAGMGIGLTVTKYVAEFKKTDPERAGRILALSTIVTIASAFIYAAAFIALASWLAENTLAAPHLAPLIQISAISVSLGVINSVQISSFAGLEAFRTSAFVRMGCGVAQTIMVITGAWQWGLKGAVAAMAAAVFMTVLVTRVAVTREWKRFNLRLNWRDAASEWRVLVNFSLPTFLTILLIGPVSWACSAFLANQPDGYAELGVFNAATQWQGAVQMLPGLVGTAMIPVMSEKYGAGDVSGSLRVMWRMIKLIACIVVPTALILSVLSPWIMKGYGDSFASEYWTMVILVAAGVLGSLMAPFTQFITAAGKMWLGLFFHAGWLVFMLSGSWLLAPSGAAGLAGARLFAVFIYIVIYMVYFYFKRFVTQ